MNYFQQYEARKSLYKKVKPGSVWKNKGNTSVIIISSVNLSRGTINGKWGYPGSIRHLHTIKWLLKYYKLVED